MKKRIIAALVLAVLLAMPFAGLASSPPSNIIHAGDHTYVVIDGVAYPYIPYNPKPQPQPQPPTAWQGPGYVSPDGSYYIKYPPYPYPYYPGTPYPGFINQQYGGAPQPADQPGRASYGDVVWSTEYLYQVYVNGRSIDFRVFIDGKKTTFKLAFEGTGYGPLRMLLTVRQSMDGLTLEYTGAALDYLEAINVTEVALTLGDGSQQRYSISGLRSGAK